MQGEHRESNEANYQRVGVEEGQKATGVIAVRSQGQSSQEIAHGHGVEQGGQHAAEREGHVPGCHPAGILDLVAIFDRHGAEDQSQQDQHQWQIKTAEDGRVDRRERGKKGSAAREQPNLVAVPEGFDGVDEAAPLLAFFCEEVPAADPEIEAVKNGIADDQNSDEEQPDDLQGDHERTSSSRGWGPLSNCRPSR